MILLRDIHLRLGGRVLFDGLGASIGPRDRIGLVGPNGAGKSTLLKLLLGEMEPDGGALEKAGFVTLGYLPQDGVHARGRSLGAELESAFEEVVSLRERVEEASGRLRALPEGDPQAAELLELIAGWEHAMEDHDAHRLPGRIEAVARGLGFAREDLGRDTSEFSGGWQMRIALAKLLLRRPSLLLLDEPTNHLDLDSLRWLEVFLQRYEGALLIVSHDREFLDRVVTRVLALRLRRIDAYTGNYSSFERQAAERRQQVESAAAAQERDLARQQAFIDRFRAKASKASVVQSRIKQLEKVERIEVEEEDEAVPVIRFPPPPRSGERVLSLRAVDKAYGDHRVFSGLDLELHRGDRLAVVGVNGAGKSTLVRLLAGREAVSGGERVEGHNVAIAYFAQHQADELSAERTVLETVEEVADPGSRTRLRTLLGAFLFRGDDVEKRVAVLSGGERSRLALAKLLLQPFNCLILDEPTNHLDLRAIGVLQSALAEYPGTLVLVSHDRAFLEPLVTKVVEVRTGGRLRVYPGRFSEFLAKLDAEEAAAAAAAAGGGGAAVAGGGGSGRAAKEDRRQRAERRAALAPLRKRVADAEAEVGRLEGEQARWEAAMAVPEFFQRGDATTTDLQTYRRVQAELAAAMESWTAAADELSLAEEP